MKKTKLTLLLAGYILSLLFPVLTFAQTSLGNPVADTLITKPLSEIVISANRFSTLNFETSEAVTVLGASTIVRNQLRSAPEALSISPGVFVQKTNHGGGSPFVRGLTGNQTLQMIDGVRLSNASSRYGPNQYFNTIDIFSIGKLEVLRGTGSVQYGSDALGGTVQAFTKELDFTGNSVWHSMLVGRFATHGMEQTTHAEVSYQNVKTAFRGGFTWRNFGDVVGGDTTGRQSPSGYKELDFDVKGKLRFSSKSDITFLYQNVNEKDVDVYHKVVLENYAVNRMEPQNRQLAYVRYNFRPAVGLLKILHVTASSHRTLEGRESRKNGSNTLRYEQDKVHSVALSAEGFLQKGKIWSASNGADFYIDMVKSKRTDTDLSSNTATNKRGLYPDGSTLGSYALFSIHTFDFDKWIVNAGARYNAFVIQVNDALLGSVTIKPSALVVNGSVMRRIGERSNVFVAANTGFRAPNIDDLGTLGIVDFRYETPNYDLKPEKSFQYQLGYKFKGNKLRGELYLYRNELYNLIVRERVEGDSIDGYAVYQKENVERAFIEGVETSLEYSFNSFLMLSGSATYTYGQNFTRNEPVRRIPPFFGRLAVEYRKTNWWSNLEWLAAAKQTRLAKGDKEDNRIPAGGTPGWNVFNVNAGYNWSFLSFDLRLQNLLDEDYRYHGSGINGYGRSALLTVKLSI